MRFSPKAGVRSAVWAALFSAILLAPAGALGQGFSRASLPVPVDVDGRPVHCRLYLNVEMKRLNLPFDTFAAGSGDQAQALFVTAIQALRTAAEAARRGPLSRPPAAARLGNVKFVLAADPVYLIFRAPRPGGSWTPAELSYDYVVREAGNYKLTNFSYSGALDDVLQDPALFDRNFLKAAPGKK